MTANEIASGKPLGIWGSALITLSKLTGQLEQMHLSTSITGDTTSLSSVTLRHRGAIAGAISTHYHGHHETTPVRTGRHSEATWEDMGFTDDERRHFEALGITDAIAARDLLAVYVSRTNDELRLLSLGAALVVQNGIEAKLARICGEQGYDILAEAFAIIVNRETFMEEDLFDAIEHLDLAEVYEAHIGPAIDEIESEMKGTFA